MKLRYMSTGRFKNNESSFSNEMSLKEFRQNRARLKALKM